VGIIEVNGEKVEAGPKENLVQAAQRLGVEIPHYCWHHDLSVVASCRMCLVEVGERKPDGTVAMLPRLVPACQTPAKDGTIVLTNTEKVKKSQAQTLEFLLLNHPLDCSICDQAGECYLQDYTYKFGNAESRLNEPKVQRMDKYHIGEQIALFTDRCVMCTRCVRFTREFSGTRELQVINRGSVEEIDVFPGHACDNKLAGNVVDLCPVGALCSKDFLYKKRVWWLKAQDSVCQGCSTGCSIHVDTAENRVFRLRPRENPDAQGSFMCDDGRFGWKYIHDENRITSPRMGRKTAAEPKPVAKNGAAKNGAAKHDGTTVYAPPATNDLASVDPWPAVLRETRKAIRDVAQFGGSHMAVVFSPMMLCEEAYLLAKYIQSIDKNIVLAMGPIPMEGEDDHYPKGPRGQQPKENIRFTIRAEKCPNRRGVAMVLSHFQKNFVVFEEVVNRVSAGKIEGVYFVGNYPSLPVNDAAIAKLSKLKTLIVQDFNTSPMSDAATLLLASSTFAESTGTVVNHAGLAQEIHTALRTPADARPTGRILFELSERQGMYQASAIRKEMATAIPEFRAFGNGEIAINGVKLSQSAATVTAKEAVKA
jgi:NADH-quinone oxidoreductase subunit G